MLHILMGRARTGKSERILREIAALGDSSKQILLVPEHASHVAEVDICRACGDTASRHAEVLTFKLLASRVLSICGGASEVTLDRGGKLLLLARTLSEVAPNLCVYRRSSQRRAFLEGLLQVVEELQSYAVSPEKLAEKVEGIAGESGDKLRDIALIYGIYMAKLHTPERDARDRLEKLEENLKESHYIDGKDIFLDGFAYFTARERNILRIMLQRANSVTVTLLGDRDDRELFAESLRVRASLLALAADAGVAADETVLPAAEEETALDRVERCFFGRDEAWAQPTDALTLYEASSAYAECEWAASEICRLVREGGMRFRDITLTARSIGTYDGVLETVLQHYGIPFYRARRSSIIEKPILSLVLGALDAACGGFEYEDVFRCLKTGLCALGAEECDVLENYVLKWDIRGSMWTREALWSAHPDGYAQDWDEGCRARLARVNALRERVRLPLQHLSEGMRGAGSARSKVTALYAFLEEIALPQQLQRLTERLFAEHSAQRAEETAQLWSIVCDVMDQFVEILGDTPLDPEEFTQLFRLVLTQYSVGTIPVTLDAVNISEMTRNDRHTVKALFLLGANDGVLPAVDRGAGILREEDRAALEQQEIDLAPYGMAQFRLEMQNLYAALAQPTQKLFVSYPTSSVSGGELRPSFVVGRLKKLCPGAAILSEDADKSYRLSSKLPALSRAGEQIGGELWDYFAQQGGGQTQLSAMESASHYVRGRLSGDAVRALYGSTVTLSASKMDQAKNCHFAYFMKYGLRAKERTEAQFDAMNVGTFIHEVMEHTLREVQDAGGIKSLSEEQLHAVVRRTIEDYIARQLPDLAEKGARFRYLFRRICQMTERLMDEVAEELRHSDFVPLAFELSFASDGQLPAITIREGERETRVTGKIDRVDGWLKDGKLYLRVVDYKTGKKSFDLADLRYGLGIQMLLYLFTLQEKGSALFGHEIVPAGVLYTPLREPIIKSARSASPEEIERAMKKELRRSGMLLSDPAVLQAMEHEALDSPCYLPISVKDGNVVSGVATLEQLGRLGSYVDYLLHEISREVFAGNIDADPSSHGQDDTACKFCEFASACHFSDGSGTDHIEYVKSTDAVEFWQHVNETVNGREEQ